MRVRTQLFLSNFPLQQISQPSSELTLEPTRWLPRPRFHLTLDFQVVTDIFQIQGDILPSTECKKTHQHRRCRARDSAGPLVIAAAHCTPYSLTRQEGISLCSRLKKRGGWKESNYYLPATAASRVPSPSPSPGAGEAASIQRDKGLDKTEERHNSICLGRAHPM